MAIEVCLVNMLIREYDKLSLSLAVLLAHAGNADMIQPGLIPLQPNLDFMDTFEPLQGTDQATLGLRLGLLD